VVSTHLKNISQIGSFPKNRDENKKYLKPPPSNSFLLEGVRHLSFGGCAQYHHMQGPTAVSVTGNGWQSDLRISLVEWFFCQGFN